MLFLHDVRHAIRRLLKTPLFTLTAMIVLALGVGFATAIFSLVDAALLRPLPFHEAHQLVMASERSPRAETSRVSMANFVDWRERSRTFEAMAAAAPAPVLTPLASTQGGAPDTVALQNVTIGFFEVLRVRPIAGRTFDARDEATTPGSDPLVVISERLWRTKFAADETLVGRGIRLGSLGRLNTVVGVVPDVELFGKADAWQFTRSAPGAQRGTRSLQVIARLKPETTIDQAQADLSAVAVHLAQAEPATNKGWSVALEPLQQAIVGPELRATSQVLGGVVLFVLLLSCANIANLLLSRGVGRAREIAVRASLGGSRMRIARQVLTESALLGLLGGLAGLGLAWALLRATPTLVPPQTIPPSIILGVDWRVATFAVVVSLLTALLFGLAPAWQAMRVPLVQAMASGGRGSSDHSARVRQTLAVLEIAVALLLTTGAGLLVRTLVWLQNVDPGYRAEHVLTMTMRVPARMVGQAKPGELAMYYENMEREISRVPGVDMVAIAGDVPLAGLTITRPFEMVGGQAPDVASRPLAHYQMVTPRYFELLGIAVLKGRGFTDRDMLTAPPVCIVNEAFVRRYVSDGNPVGARVTVDSMDVQPKPVTREIVGVVRQVKARPDESSENVEIYVPLAQNAWAIHTVAIRAAGEPMRLVPSIQAAVARVDPLQIVTRPRTMEAVASDSTARPRFRAQLVSAFALVAVALSAVGIFSVLMFIVQERMREFTVRLAVGATPRALIGLVLRDGLKLAAIGLTIGLVASLLLARSLGTLLYGVAPIDPATFVVTPIVLTIVALVASIAPAMRTMRVDPAAVLRDN